MTKNEFRKNAPGLINHKSHGVQYLEIVEGSNKFMACYRSDRTNVSSFGSYGDTWQELYDDLLSGLNDNMDTLENPPFQVSE